MQPLDTEQSMCGSWLSTEASPSFLKVVRKCWENKKMCVKTEDVRRWKNARTLMHRHLGAENYGTRNHISLCVMGHGMQELH